jgi:hypothetical protein
MANIFPVVAQIHLRNKNDISACFYVLLKCVAISTGNGGDILAVLLLSRNIAGAVFKLPLHFAGIHFGA